MWREKGKGKGGVPGDDRINRDHENNPYIVALEIWFIVVPQVEVYQREGKDGVESRENAANEPAYTVCLSEEKCQSEEQRKPDNREEGGERTSH